MFIRKVMRRTFSSDYLATNTYNQMSFSQKSYQKVIIGIYNQQRFFYYNYFTSLQLLFFAIDATRKRFHLIQRTKGDVQKLTVNYIKHVMRSEFNVHHEAKKRFQSSL